MKEWWENFKEVIYLVTIIGMGAGWYASAKISKKMNELKDEAQDAKIETLSNENSELRFELAKQKDYVKENSDNILWIVRILEFDTE